MRDTPLTLEYGLSCTIGILAYKNIGRDHDGCFDQRLNKECLCNYTITQYKQLGIKITNKYIYFQPIPVFSTIPFFFPFNFIHII